MKEQDALWIKRGVDGISQTVMMPVRLIMNNKTLTILEGVDFNKLVFVYNLPESSFSNSLNKKECFVVSSKGKAREMTFCPFGISNTGVEWVNEWDYDFNLFKNQCSVSKDTTTLDITGLDENKINNQLTQLKADIIKEKEKQIAKEMEDEQITKDDDVVNDAELQAINKQFDIELLLEKEEREKELLMEEELKGQIDKEKEKRNCLLKKIQEKAQENQYNMLAEQRKNDINDKKDGIIFSLNNEKSKWQERLNQLKERALRRRRKLDQQLNLVRSEINSDVDNAYKKSNYKCTYTPNSPLDTYCNARYAADPEMNGKCRKSGDSAENWCTFCCNNENGSMYMDLRQKCYEDCTGYGLKKVGSQDEQTKWFMGAFKPTQTPTITLV